MICENCAIPHLITLTLNNLSATTSTVVSLFDSQINYSEGTTKYQTALFNFVAGTTATWSITSTETGVVSYNGDFSTMDLVIAALNGTFQENGTGVFTYEQVGAQYRLVAYSNDYTFTTVTPYLQAPEAFTTSASSIVAGTTATITSGMSTLTYTEVVQQVCFNPYLLFNAYIKSTTAAQLSEQFNITTRDPSGHQDINIIFPAIDPTQSQNALDNITMDYLPSPLNKMEYTLRPSEEVKMQFMYIGGDYYDLPKIVATYKKNKAILLSGNIDQLAEYRRTYVPKPEEKMKTKEIRITSNPLIATVLKNNPRIVNAMLSVEAPPKKRKITEEEIYSAFSGTDFRGDTA